MSTPEDRSAQASIAANTRWAHTPDRLGATAPARRGLIAKFEREVDPENKLDPAVRARLVENARKAYYRRLARKSAAARRKKAA